MAITGSDPFLREGSDVTVLFHVNNREAFLAGVDPFITEAKKEFGDRLTEKKTTYLKIPIESFVTPLREVSVHRAAYAQQPYLNSQCFADPGDQQAGNAPRYFSNIRGDSIRNFDVSFMKSATLPRESRGFHMAFQLALFEARTAIEAVLNSAAPSSPETAMLIRVGLLNYVAGAIMMPYDPYLSTARAMRHDMEAIAARFGVSFEQACHRL